MTIMEFLNARLAEDEAVAKAATHGPWHSEEEYVWGRDDEGVIACAKGIWPEEEELIPVEHTDVTHIARHDPARVLQEVQAKRAVLAQREDLLGTHDPALGDLNEVVAHLAAVYSDHPDYRKEWAA